MFQEISWTARMSFTSHVRPISPYLDKHSHLPGWQLIDLHGSLT